MGPAWCACNIAARTCPGQLLLPGASVETKYNQYCKRNRASSLLCACFACTVAASIPFEQSNRAGREVGVSHLRLLALQPCLPAPSTQHIAQVWFRWWPPQAARAPLQLHGRAAQPAAAWGTCAAGEPPGTAREGPPSAHQTKQWAPFHATGLRRHMSFDLIPDGPWVKLGQAEQSDCCVQQLQTPSRTDIAMHSMFTTACFLCQIYMIIWPRLYW